MHMKNKKISVTYVLDNGAYTAKIGTSSSKQPEVIPNCIMKVKSERRRPFVGDQINECRDVSGLFYILPFQRGYLVNWDVQKTVWDYIFTKDICYGRLSEHPICITEPMFNFQSNQEAMDEIFFEEYECCGILRLPAPDLCAYHYSKENSSCKTCLVIDTGYSFTHIVPYINGKKYLPAVKRIDVGGKILTNHLKEIISYRQLHVMDETYVINQVKEDACFISENFRADMLQTSYKDERNTIIKEYVLPDYSVLKRGYLRPIKSGEEKKASVTNLLASNNHVINGLTKLNGIIPNHVNKMIANSPNGLNVPADKLLNVEQQTIILNNERITVPEILFHPSDIGISQMGIPEAVVECVKECPEGSIYPLLGNIVVVGGNAQFPNFSKRLYSEIRQRFDTNMTVNLFSPTNPITYAWHGGKKLGLDEEFYKYMVSKEEYEEYGHNFSREHLENFKINV